MQRHTGLHAPTQLKNDADALIVLILDLEPALLKEKKITLKQELNAKRSISKFKGKRSISSLGGYIIWT